MTCLCGAEEPVRCHAPSRSGQSWIVREGDDGTFLCYGTTVEPALSAARILSEQRQAEVAVVNARFAKPLDAALITRLIQSGKPMLVCEDHAVAGGFGSAVIELAADRGLRADNVRLVGLPDRYVSFASRQGQLTEVGLDATHLAAGMWDLIRAGRGAGSPAPKAGR